MGSGRHSREAVTFSSEARILPLGKVGGLTKLYVWSVVFEPLLFFVIAGQQVTGVGGNVSRLFQFLVLIGLGLKSLHNNGVIRVPRGTAPLYWPYFRYFLFAVIAGVIGLASGAYALNEVYEVRVASALSQFVNGPLIRPLFEYFITIYFFLYFVVLARYLLNSREAVDYYFKVFAGLFLLSLTIGLADVAQQRLLGFGEWIPRHISDWRHIGMRFHGFAGEPRDAFIYLILGLAIFSLRDYWRDERRLKLWFIAVCGVAALLTESFSGLIGLGISGLLILLYYAPRVSVKKVMVGLGIFGLLGAVMYVGAVNSPRVLSYLDALRFLRALLESGQPVTSVLQVAMNNIYPVWERWDGLSEFNILPIITGTGFGTASVANSNLANTHEVMNPNANIVRTFFETGIVGIYLLVAAFILPIRKLRAPREVRQRLTLWMLLLVGAYFGHRSVAPYLFLGITIAALEQKWVRGHNEATASSAARAA